MEALYNLFWFVGPAGVVAAGLLLLRAKTWRQRRAVFIIVPAGIALLVGWFALISLANKVADVAVLVLSDGPRAVLVDGLRVESLAGTVYRLNDGRVIDGREGELFGVASLAFLLGFLFGLLVAAALAAQRWPWLARLGVGVVGFVKSHCHELEPLLPRNARR